MLEKQESSREDISDHSVDWETYEVNKARSNLYGHADEMICSLAPGEDDEFRDQVDSDDMGDNLSFAPKLDQSKLKSSAALVMTKDHLEPRSEKKVSVVSPAIAGPGSNDGKSHRKNLHAYLEDDACNEAFEALAK